MEQKPVWPGWETVKLIGRGSFGVVYEIQRDVFGNLEQAALKVITIPQNPGDVDEMYNEGYDDESITTAFEGHLKAIVAEYSLMRKLNGCTNIVNCDDIRYVQHDDSIGWDIFIKMELLTPLLKTLPAEIPEETVIKIGEDICTALELCRENGIVHRDIKPQNIFVSKYGDYKLGDFGIAKTVEKTMGGTKIGTYKYMAPEVYNNQPYGTGADIYSLGLVLYWLLNEKRMPFLPLPPEKLSYGMEETARHRRFDGETLPAPAHGSERLKEIVLKACAYKPDERYHTAGEMRDALRQLHTDMTGAALAAEMQRKHAEELERLQREEEERLRLEREAAAEEKRRLEEAARPEREREEQERLRLEREAAEEQRRQEEEAAQLERERKEQERLARAREAAEAKRRKKEETRRKRREKGADTPKTEQEKKADVLIAAVVLSAAILVVILLGMAFRSCTSRTGNGIGSNKPIPNETVGTYIQSISIKTKPNKTDYYVGEKLDTTGLTLTAHYGDGTQKAITSGFTCQMSKINVGGQTIVTVTYEGKMTTFAIQVLQNEVTRISVSTLPNQLEYYVGEKMDTTGLTLTAHYSDGTTKNITSGFSCQPSVLSSVGQTMVTVTYEGQKTTFPVQVLANEATRITVKTLPNKTEYYVGDTLNTTGLTLTAHYSNGTTKTISSGFTCQPSVLNAEGITTVTVTYEGQKVTFGVRVLPVTVTSISIHTLPAKRTYFVGDTLDIGGLMLNVNYNDGTAQTITSGFTCDPQVLDKAGTKTITVHYGGQTAQFTVDVSAVSVSSISIKSKPSKTTYYAGDMLSTSGLKLTVSYNDGTTKTISSGFSCSPTTLNTAGTQTITVSYGGKSAKFTVDVNAVVVSSIAINTLPTKTSYYIGDTLSTSGMMINVTYNNGTTKTISSGYTCSPSTSSTFKTAGTHAITVIYDGKGASFTVTVRKPTITLSKYSETISMSCWPYSYYNNGTSKAPCWMITLPEVTRTPSNGSVEWSIVSGQAKIGSGCISALQPGTIVARATLTYKGYSYSADYSVTFSLYKTTSAGNYLRSGPGTGYSQVGVVPTGETVTIMEVFFDQSVYETSDRYFTWAKVTYNGVTGWIVIS